MTAKMTKNQSLVFNVLDAARNPLGAYDILDQLRDEGFKAPLQVYRALDKLIEQGLVHRLDSLNAFVICRHDHEGHGGIVAFAICNECGLVSEFEDDDIRHRLSDWSKRHGFHQQTSTIEIRGLCQECG